MLRIIKVAAVCLCLMIALTASAKISFAQSSHAIAAKPYDPSLFNALRWRSIGPNRGGRSITCAGSTSRPFEYYFGAVGGGLWKTVDGGVTWRPVTDGQLKSSSVGAVAVSESNPDVVFIGMGETQLRGNIMQGDGVYKTTDAGKTWSHSDSATPRQSRVFAFTRPIPIWFTCARWDIPTVPMTSGAFFARRTEARAGRRFCSAAIIPARSILASIQKTLA